MLSKAWVPRSHVVHHYISCCVCMCKSTLAHSRWCSHSRTYIHTCMTVPYVNHLLSIPWSFFSHWRRLICANQTPALLLCPWGCAECTSCWLCRDPSSRGEGHRWSELGHLHQCSQVSLVFSGWRICLKCRRPQAGLHPESGRSSGGGSLVFLPGESHGQRSLLGYGPWGHK